MYDETDITFKHLTSLNAGSHFYFKSNTIQKVEAFLRKGEKFYQT